MHISTLYQSNFEAHNVLLSHTQALRAQLVFDFTERW